MEGTDGRDENQQQQQQHQRIMLFHFGAPGLCKHKSSIVCLRIDDVFLCPDAFYFLVTANVAACH